MAAPLELDQLSPLQGAAPDPPGRHSPGCGSPARDRMPVSRTALIIRAITCSALCSSRLPVGSSASSQRG